MAIATEYIHYLKGRQSGIVGGSFIENDCKYCISQLGIEEDFALLYVEHHYFTYCFCHYIYNAKDSRRPYFYLDLPSSFTHKVSEFISEQKLDLNKLNTLVFHDGSRYIYDNYYDRFIPDGALKYLVNSINDLPLLADIPVFVMSKCDENRLLLYSLQSKFKSVHFIGKETKSGNTVISPRCLFPDETKKTIELLENGTKVKYSLENIGGKSIVIPYVEETLTSTFFGDFTWQDIADLSNRCDGYLCDIPIKHLTLRLMVDGYQNVFLGVNTNSTGEGIKRKLLLYNKYCVDLSDNQSINSKLTVPQKKTEYNQLSRSVKLEKNNKGSESHHNNAGRQIKNNSSDTIRFNGVEFPYKTIMQDIDNIDEKELITYQTQLQQALDSIFDCDVFLADTNFWIQEDENKNWKYQWILEEARKKYWLNKKNIVEIQRDVYDEIAKKSKSMKSAEQAKYYIADTLLQLHLAVLPGVRRDLKMNAYADNKIYDRIAEILHERRRLTVVSADTDGINRWIGNSNNIEKEVDFSNYVFIRPKYLVGIIQLNNKVKKYFNNKQRNK